VAEHRGHRLVGRESGQEKWPSIEVIGSSGEKSGVMTLAEATRAAVAEAGPLTAPRHAVFSSLTRHASILMLAAARAKIPPFQKVIPT
jgi:hypothetical protein